MSLSSAEWHNKAVMDTMIEITIGQMEKAGVVRFADLLLIFCKSLHASILIECIIG